VTGAIEQHGNSHWGHGHGHDNSRDEDRRTVAILTEDRHLRNAAIIEACAAFESAGYQVQVVAPGPDDLFDIPANAPAWNAVLSRGRNQAALSILAATANLGVLTINTPRSIDLVRNKIAMQSLLSHHGMPLPRSWFAANPSVFRQVPSEYYPLIVKPFDGDGSAGIWYLREPTDCELLARAPGEGTLYIAQEYLETGGWDIKLYGIGSRIWAVRKASPVSFPDVGPALLRPSDDAELIDLDAQLSDIALTCGRACGLEFWGVDVALTSRGPFVIEVNDFPTYSAVPEAGALIARHAMTLIDLNMLTRQAGHEHMVSIIRSVS
jgi:ribosomal protein S6--L-glutamate ligase